MDGSLHQKEERNEQAKLQLGGVRLSGQRRIKLNVQV